jgi:hypothetical protein
MKKNIFSLFITISFLMVNIPFQLFGQGRGIWCEPDTITTHTILYQTADSILMAPETRYIATYNDELLKTSETTLSWDEATQAFTIQYEIYNTFTYNALGLLETSTEANNWDDYGTNNFITFYRYSYLYDTLNRVSQIITEMWDDSLEMLVNSQKDIYTYNEHGDLSSVLNHGWHVENQAWVLSGGFNHFYVYDDNFNILIDTLAYVNWADTSVYIYTYYPNGNVHTEVSASCTEYWPWQWSDSTVYLYDDNNNMTRWTRYEWNDDSMRFIHASWNGRLSFTYDENNNRTSAVRETYKYYNQTWEYDGWNPKLVWTYDDNDNATLIESFAWNSDLNDWERNISGHVEIFYNNMRSGYEMFGLGGSIFNIHYICKEESVAVKETKNPTVLIYPNPAQDRVFISGITEKSQLAIYDISGKLVLKQTISSEQTINVNNLKSGIYLINIRNNTQNITKKLLISE